TALRAASAAAAIDDKSLDVLERTLNKLEKRARGVEEQLSVLKRRRALARLNPRFTSGYRSAAQRAAAAYPFSEPLAAVAAAAILERTAISAGVETELKKYLPLISETRFSPLALSLHVLLGDMQSPDAAAAVFRTGQGDLLSAALPLLWDASPGEREALSTDLAILRILRGNSGEALGEIQEISQARPSPEFIRFAAEYFYDFGDPLRAAELFSRLGTAGGIAREADALWLAGYTDSARNLWTILSAPVPEDDVNPRALYNLAVTAENTGASAALLERLAGLPPPEKSTGAAALASQTFGIIRYSRLLNANAAAAVLASAAQPHALTDLELLRRRSENWETDRVVSEIWLLLGRYPADQRLYQWAAWYFDYQRKTGEIAQLQKNAARNNLDEPALHLQEALREIQEGNLDRGEKILRSISDNSAMQEIPWPVFANLGRILEARHSPAAAINSYETASGLTANPKTASRIQVRIAACLKSLGQDRESRRALEYALELDPDNLNARLELSRLNQ
ncbi:MAG: hypothetical protein LBN21_12575, partial [Treponema sp.]|nr:hypothetical protein [Treponema sp.]